MEYTNDCLHLHACRRLCKMFGIKGRGCNENCTAYHSEKSYWLLSNGALDDAFDEVVRGLEYTRDIYEAKSWGYDVVSERKIVFSRPINKN